MKRVVWAFFCGCMLLLSACGDPLNDTYGIIQPGSINGVSVLHKIVEEKTDLENSLLLGTQRCEEADFLICIPRDHSISDEVLDYLVEWLEDEPDRQVLLLLKGANNTEWLCRRWANEARAEARRYPDQAEKLNAIADDIEKRGKSASTNRGTFIDHDAFSTETFQPIHPTAINGPSLTTVPIAMQQTAALKVHKSITPLITTSVAAPATAGVLEAETKERIWLGAVHIGRNAGRLVVVADSQPLLDGALPDVAARELLSTTVNLVMSFHTETPQAVWVEHMRVHGDDPPVNPMLRVLTMPPVSWATWHLIVLVFVVMFVGAGWLGRREAMRDLRPERFSRHVLALADRLRRDQEVSWCTFAIARVLFGRAKKPPAGLDAAAAAEWLSDISSSTTTSSQSSAVPPSRST